MTEQMFWHQTVKPNLSPFGMVRRIENGTEKGTPDVIACLRRRPYAPAFTSWIELKMSYEWPVRSSTTVKFNHYELDQILWLECWAAAGGLCCLLVQVATDYMLIPPSKARPLYYGMTKAEILAAADIHGERSFPTGAVIKWLTTPVPSIAPISAT